MSEETQTDRNRRMREWFEEANRTPPITGPMPQEGETWAPCAPWPEQGCPTGMYVHGLSLALVGGKAGFTFAISGATDISFDTEPMSHEGATAGAWEYRYGSASFKERYGTQQEIGKDFEASVKLMGRYGDGAVKIMAAGLETIWVRRENGTQTTMFAADMRRAFVRVAEAPPPLAEICL